MTAMDTQDAQTPREAPAPLLAVENVTISYRSEDGRRDAVRDVSLSVRPREAYGLVGGSGSRAAARAPWPMP